ncbi:hypothetical protein M9H77_13586 [Catharanthus roseus]|uniref:Uncharacterized protein n=1 Tax=Catharanthus roseus TaxID=4058 RepID=A0ACC0BKK7_CATRO|nr:hypothetical protein M9H77_13586 [Catharanthus roseus]
MDATHPVRGDAYGSYFTGLVQKTWTFNRRVSHAELVRKILKHRDMDPNFWSIQITMRVPSFYEEYHMFYFTLFNMNNDNEMRYFWTIAPNLAKKGIQVLVEFIPIQPQTISITHDTNTINMTKHGTSITQMVSDEPPIFYPTVDEDDDENGHLDEDYAISSESESDNNNDVEEEELQLP